MPDLFDTTQVPDEDAHWDALAARVAAGASRNSKAGGFGWFAHSRASWVAASLLLAAALGLMMVPAEGASARTFTAEWSQALAPVDDVGRAIASNDGPPSIGSLLLDGEGGGVR